MRLERRLMLAILLVFVASSTARAARWSYQTVADGLPSNRILDLTEGADQTVWAATEGGLARLEGSWKTVSPHFFTTLELGADGQVWAGASSNASTGHLQLFAADGSSLPLPAGLSGLANAPIKDLAAGPGGELWIATLNQNLLRWYDPGGGYVLEEAFPAIATAVDVDAAGRAWWTAQQSPGVDRVWSWTAGNLEFVDITMTGASALGSVLALADGSAVAGASQVSNAPFGAWWMEAGGTAQRLPGPTAAASNPGEVSALFEDARGRVWAGRNSAFRFDRPASPTDPSQWALKTYSSEDGLGGDPVNAILEVGTSAGTGVQRQLWLATNLGASILTDFSWAQFAAPEGLIQDQCNIALGNCNTVLSLASDPNADVAYFGAQYGLSRLVNGSEWTGWVHDLPPLSNGPLLHPQVNALHVDDDGTLWVATGDLTPTTGGLQTLVDDGNQETWTTQGRATDGLRWKITGIGRDAEDALWLAAADGAWRRTLNGSETQYTDADGLPTGPLSALAIGPAGVAVGGVGALARYDTASNTWTPLSLADTGLPGATVTIVLDLYLDDEYLVVATALGLIVADANATSLAEATILDPSVGFAQEIFGVDRDSDGFLLAATASGLYRVRSDLSEWVRLGAGNGLPGEDLFTVRVRDDEIYLGMQGDGAAAHAFAPPITAITLAPPTVITSSSLPVTVQVNASDPDSDPAATLFQYRVDELAWSLPSADRNITLVVGALGISDGAHRLEVRAQDAEFNLDPTPAVALFEVDTTPPVPVLAAPGAGTVLREVVSIHGKADDARFAKYWVGVWPVGTTIAEADTLQGWTFTPVLDGELASWDTKDFEDDRWVLRVTVEDTLGIAGYTQIEVLVDNVYPFAEITSPVIALGDNGARVFSSDGIFLLDFPPKSFEGERTLTVDRESNSESEGDDAYRGGPNDLELTKPATLTWTLQGALADQSLTIHQAVNGEWVALGGTRTQVEGQMALVVSVDRLGLFALRSGAASGSGTVIGGLQAEPRLLQPRQGPSMSISFELGQASGVRAVVYSRSGRPRRVLADGTQLGPGRQVLLWDGRDNDSEIVAEGLYIVAVEAGGETMKQVVTVGRY